jgi:4-azaleucine resistance transporter AzlC
MNKKLLKTVFRDTVPVLTGYLFLGMGFGILLSEAGYGPGWALLMSLCIYAGSGQYLLVSMLSAGASLLSTAVATLLVNARHLFYGISLVDTYKDAGKKKPYMIFALTDETYSLVTQTKLPEGLNKTAYCFWVSLFDQCYWIAGCVLGSVAGTLLPVDFTGVSFVLTALFVTMFVEQWLTHKDHGPAIIGVVCTAVCLLIFGSELFLIPSMVAIAGLLILRRKTGRRQEDE